MCLCGRGCSGPGVCPGTPTLSSPARVNSLCALREYTATPTLHLSSPIVHGGSDRVIQYLHT